MNEFLKSFADDLVKDSEYKSDPNAYVHSAVSIIGGLLGNLIQSKEEEVYPNLYSVLLGETGQGKSSYAKRIIKYVEKLQMLKTKLSKIHRKTRKKEEEEHKKKQKENPNILLDYKPTPYPKGVYYEPRSFFVPDATREALEEHAAKVSWGNMFLFKDELGGFFDSFKKAGREEDQTAYNSLYNPSITHEVLRKTKDAKIPIIHYPVMNLSGCTTLGTFNEIIASYKKRKRHEGILSRFQHVYILPKDKSQRKERELVDEGFDNKFKDLLLNIIDRQIYVGKKKKAEQNSDIVEENNGFIVFIKRSQEASRLHRQYSDEIIERNYACKDIMFKEYLTRNPEFVTKVSLIFHAIKRFDAGLDIFAEEENSISPSTMEEAIEYVRMITKKAESLFVEGDICLDTPDLANEIFDYITKAGNSFWKKYAKTPWTARELASLQLRIFPRKANGNIDMPRIYEVLDYLVNNEKLYFVEEQHKGNKTIITKYSFEPPVTPPPDQGNTPLENTGPQTPKMEKPINGTNYNNSLKKTYSTNLSLKDHLKNIKDKIDVREFLKKYLDIKKGVALCPFHDDRNPSLSVTRQYYHCFSCGVHGDSLDFLINLRGLDFKDALKELEYYSNTNPIVVKEEPKIDNSASLQKQLNEIWNTAVFTSDDKLYLKKRWNLDKQQAKPVPLKISALRYHPHLQYTSIGNDKLFYPALISKIEDKFGNFIGLQRTYLSDDFTFKRDISPVRKILGRLSGGYVAIEEFTQNNRLYVGEGVESVYSAKLLLGNEGSYYAALSSTNLPDLPSRFNEIVILADNDEAGISFAERMKEKYKDKVSVLFPERQYKDFNDQLIGI